MTTAPALPPSIGAATLEADGTLRLRLRAEGPGGIVGDGELVYAPDHPDYGSVRAHVEGDGGVLRVGEPRPVPPFPD